MKKRPLKDRILIISRQSDKPTLDIRLLREWLRENCPELECVVLSRRLEGRSKLGYIPHMFIQMSLMASSRVVVLDGYCIAASVLEHRPETKIVQIWHALAAIKQFGYQAVDKPSGRSREIAELLCMHKNYDFVIAPGEVTGRHFSECFQVSEEKLKYICLPRVDEILRPDRILPGDFRGNVDEFREHVRAKYGVSDGREMILYVPTFRKDKNVKLRGLIRALHETQFKLVIKPHPVYDGLDWEGISPDEEPDIIVGSELNSYQWLQVCDRIITDYSALGIEAALLGKPVYYYVYDIEDYRVNVGLNMDPSVELPSFTAVEAGELADILSREYDYEQLDAFRRKYVSADTSHCTEDLGSFIAGLAKEVK